MKQVQLNNTVYQVDDRLQDFSICQRHSSNVDFFGANFKTDQLFFQFKPGKNGVANVYIFSGVTIDVLDQLYKCESVGKFFASNIRGKFDSIKIEGALVRFKEAIAC